MTLADQCVKRALLFRASQSQGDLTNASVPAGTFAPLVGGDSAFMQAD